MKLSQIAEKTGYGFKEFQLKTYDKSGKVPVVLYQQCRLIQLIHPPCIESVFSGFHPDAISKWTESRDTDPVTLYQHLKILAEYSHYKDINLGYIKAPTSWEEHEQLAVNISLQKFLGRFSSKNPKAHPLTCQQIIDHLDTFLNMIEIQVMRAKEQKSIKRAKKSSAKSFLRNYIKSYLNNKKPEEPLRTNGNMHLEMIKIAQIRNESCVNEIAPNLVSSVYREVLREMGVHRKGGAPVKHKKVK